MTEMHLSIFSQDAITVPIDSDAPKYKLFDATGVFLATLFGGLLGGCLLMALNYRRMKQTENAIFAAIAGVVISALAIGLGAVIPKGIELPIGIGLLFAMKNVAQSLQGKSIQQHFDKGGLIGSGWAAFGFGFIALAIFVTAFGIWYGGVVALQSIENGPKVRIGTEGEIYYSGSASRQDAQALGDELQSIKYFTGQGADVLLAKDSSGTTVSFVVRDGYWQAPGMLAKFEEVGREIAPSVGGYPIRIRLLNSNKEEEAQSLIGRVVIGSKDNIYFYGSATEADSRSLGTALQSAGYFVDKGITVLLNKDNGGTTISFVVKDGYWEDSDHMADFEALTRQVASSVGGLPVTLHVVNPELELGKEETIR